MFQRTPSSIDVRNNHADRPRVVRRRSSRAGSSEWLFNFATLQTGGFADEDLVKDGWTDISQRIRDRVVVEHRRSRRASSTLERMPAAPTRRATTRRWTEIRARVDAIVEDRRPRPALKPWYRQLCKRPCFHDEYLQAFNRARTCTSSTPTARASSASTRPASWVGGEHYELDCLIFASGFEVGTEYARRAGFETIGRDGVTLSREVGGRHAHAARHARARLPEPVHRRLDAGREPHLEHHEQPDRGRHDDRRVIVQHALDVGADEVEVTEDAEQAWVALLRGQPASFLGNPDCTPGYYNNEGGPIGPRERLNTSGYPRGRSRSSSTSTSGGPGRFDGLVFGRRPRRRAPRPERSHMRPPPSVRLLLALALLAACRGDGDDLVLVGTVERTLVELVGARLRDDRRVHRRRARRARATRASSLVQLDPHARRGRAGPGGGAAAGARTAHGDGGRGRPRARHRPRSGRRGLGAGPRARAQLARDEAAARLREARGAAGGRAPAPRRARAARAGGRRRRPDSRSIWASACRPAPWSPCVLDGAALGAGVDPRARRRAASARASPREVDASTASPRRSPAGCSTSRASRRSRRTSRSPSASASTSSTRRASRSPTRPPTLRPGLPAEVRLALGRRRERGIAPAGRSRRAGSRAASATRVAVDGVDLAVERGEVFGCLGPERIRQVDADAHAARAPRADRGRGARCSAISMPARRRAAAARTSAT